MMSRSNYRADSAECIKGLNPIALHLKYYWSLSDLPFWIGVHLQFANNAEQQYGLQLVVTC